MDYGAALPIAFGIALTLAAAGLLGAIPFIMVFRWWSEGTVSGIEALSLSGMFGLLFVLVIALPDARPFLLLIMVGGVLGLTALPALASRKSNQQFEEMKEGVYRTAIENNPRNVAARIELARNLYTQKRLSEAVEELERAIQLSPATTVNEQHLLKVWLSERDAQPTSNVTCRWCREETPADRPECVHCGRPTSNLREVADALKEDIPGMVRSVLILMATLIVVGFLFSYLSNTLGGMIAMSVVVVAGLWWVRSRL